MGQQRFNPWFVAGDLVVANMQAGAALWKRLSSAESEAERPSIAAEEADAAPVKPPRKTLAASAKRPGKRSPRKR